MCQHEIDFVVKRLPHNLYIQSAFSMPTKEKIDQELLPLRKGGDFFGKMVTNGYSSPWSSIVHTNGIVTSTPPVHGQSPAPGS